MEGTAVTPGLVIRAVLELLFLLAVLGGLLFLTDLRKRLFSLGASALAVFFVFIGAWGVVQMVDRWQYDYPQSVSYVPLTRFAMYQAQVASSVESTYSWQATLADGSQREVNVADEFAAIGLPPTSTRMRVLMEWTYEGTEQEREEAAGELELYAQGLAAALAEDGLDVAELGFYRVTGSPGDLETELLISWDAASLEAGS